MIHINDELPGTVVTLVDYVNERKSARDVNYASLTARGVVRCEVYVNDVLIEMVYAGNGGSHSWWTPAGGKFFPPHAAPQGLMPGERLVVKVDGPCALRLDWFN